MVDLRLGDSAEVLKKIESESVDLTVTSPPYDNMRAYKGNISQWSFNKFQDIAKELYRVTKEGGVVVWIVGDQTKNGNESGTSFRQALYFKEIGFNLHDTMIYEKSQACFGSNNCYLQSFEYMFVFSKGKPKSINLIRDRKNKRCGFESMGAGGVSYNGDKKKRIRKELKEYGRRKNIWTYGVGGGHYNHPAVFPLQLAIDHILSWSNEGDTVLDCFMGSGTTGEAAIRNNRNFLGIELEEEYFNMSKNRLENILKEEE